MVTLSQSRKCYSQSNGTIKVLGKGAVGHNPKVAAPGYIVLLPQGRPHHKPYRTNSNAPIMRPAYMMRTSCFSTSNYDLDSGIEYLLF